MASDFLKRMAEQSRARAVDTEKRDARNDSTAGRVSPFLQRMAADSRTRVDREDEKSYGGSKFVAPAVSTTSTTDKTKPGLLDKVQGDLSRGKVTMPSVAPLASSPMAWGNEERAASPAALKARGGALTMEIERAKKELLAEQAKKPQGAGYEYYNPREYELERQIKDLNARQGDVAGRHYYADSSEKLAALKEKPGVYTRYTDAKGKRDDLEKLTRAQVEAVADDYTYLEGKYGVRPGDLDGYGALLTRLKRELDGEVVALGAAGVDFDKLTRYEEKLAGEVVQAQATQEFDRFADKHPVLASGVSMLASPFQLLDAAPNLIHYGGKSDVADLDSYEPMSTADFPISNYVSATRGTVAGKIEDSTSLKLGGQNVASFLYQTGMSIGDSAIQVGTLGPAAALFMGAGAATNGARDIVARGGTNEQAFWGGLAAGAAETIFEKVSIENLLKVKNVSGWKDVLQEVAKQAGVEASEEMFTEVANILSDGAIMGEKSNFNMAVQEYMTQGMGEEEAKQKAFLDNVAQVAWAGAGGAISGGVMGGVKNSVDYAAGRVNAKDKGGITNTAAERILADGNAVAELERTAGLTLAPDMTQSQRRAAVKDAVSTLASPSMAANQTAQPVDTGTQERGIWGTSEQDQVIRAAALNAMVSGGKTVGENGVKAFTATYDGAAEPAAYYGGFMQYYNAGVSGQSQRSVKVAYGDALSPAQKLAAWSAGKNDSAATLAAEQSARDTVTVYSEGGGLIRTESAAALDEATADIVDRMARAVGTKVIVDPTISAPDGRASAANGYYRDGVIHIAADAANPALVVMKHEVTHRMQELSPDSYRKFRDYAVRLTQDSTQEIERLKYEYAQAGQNLSNEQAMDEIAANLTERLLTDKDSVEQFIRDDRSAAQKFFDVLKRLVQTVKEKLGRSELTLEQAERIWKDAFRAAEQVSTMSIKEQQVEFSDASTRYSIRENDPPKKTGIAYKVFLARDGQLYPPMVANPGGAGTPVGVWLDADVGQSAPPSKTGRAQVQGGGKGTNSGKISLAFRPGWHLGDTPLAKQFGRMNPETGVKDLFPADFVWAECEYAMDVDYQEEAMSYGYTENGKFRHSYAGLPKLPADGYYHYRTNPNPDTVPWVITGAMKVTRILTDSETDAICLEQGVEPMKRQGGPIDLSKYGLEAGSTEGKTKFSLKTDSQGRELTAEQAEFFKDSKVRDDDGNLLVVYHGTTSDFTKFAIGDVGYHLGTKEQAERRVRNEGNLMRLYVNIQHPLEIEADYGDWSGNNLATMFLANSYFNSPDVAGRLEEILSIDRAIRGQSASVRKNIAMRELLQSMGYDGIRYANQFEGKGYSYIAFSPEQIKSVDNKTPTKDPDIRYSIKADNLGRELSERQAQYFQDSKAVDKEGRLLVLYHGTAAYGQITTFKKGKKGWLGPGIYLTSRQSDAQRYADTMGPGGTMYELYANVTNPLLVRANNPVPEILLTAYGRESVYKARTANQGNDTSIITPADIKKLQSKGYDGILWRFGSTEEFSVFSPEQIKRVDNMKPTADKDIRYSLKEYSEQEREQHDKTALAHFGRTIKWAETGYLLLGGEKLDFSGRNNGAPGGYRTVDHREISDALGLDYGGDDYSGAMVQFMSEGNIRIMPESSGINLSVAPTKAQERALDDFISKERGEVILDIDDRNGDTIVSVEYPRGTRASKVLSDIQQYFNDGTQPYVSDVSKFRYSLKDKGQEAEVARLRELNEYLREQLRVSTAAKTSKKAVEKLARAVLQEYSSDFNVETLVTRLLAMYDWIANGKDTAGNELAWNTLKREAGSIAADILAESAQLNDEMYNDYKSLRDHVRAAKIKVPRDYWSELDVMGGYNEFRKRNMGRMNLSSTEGMGIDQVYQELSAMWPEFFDDERVSHPADQLMRISEILDSLRPVYENPFATDQGQAVEYLAADLIEKFYDTPQQAPTYADRQTRKMTQQKIQEGKKLENLRQQKNKRIEAIKKQGKARVLEVVERERKIRYEKMSALKDHYQGKEKAGVERRNAAELRRKITRRASTLSQKLLRPSDKQHVPEMLRKPVAALLNAINLESPYVYDPKLGYWMKGGEGLPSSRTEAMRQLREAYQKVLQSGESLVLDPDLLGDKATLGNLDAVIEMKDTKLADMGREQLETVWRTLRAIEASVFTANKTLAKSRYETISEMGTAMYYDFLHSKPHEERYGVRGMLEKLVNVDMLSPVDYFKELGNAGAAMWNELRDALDQKVRDTKVISDYGADLLGETDIRDWGGKKAQMQTFELSDGTIKLTTAQVMSLYMLMKRKQSHEHILKGGIRQAPVMQKGKVVKSYAPVHVTIADLATIVGTLTDEQRRIAEGLGKFMSTTLSDWGNEVSMAMYGYNKFTEENYFPIKVDENYTKTEFASGQDQRVKNMGFTKATVPHANNAVMVEDIFDVFTRHADDMSTYHAFAAALEDVERVYNFRYRNEDGGVMGSVSQTIEKVLGKDGKSYFRNLMRNLNEGIRKDDAGTLSRHLVGNYKAAAVGANLRVIIQQPTAIVRASAIIDPKYLVSGMAKKGDFELVKKWAPIAQWKDWGYFQLDTGRQMKDIMLGTDSTLDKVREAAMAGAGWADNITWSRLWNACELEIADKRPDLSKGSDAFYKAVAERFGEVVDQTQVVDSVLHRSQAMRSGDLLVNMATSFMAEPTKTYNLFRTAAREALTSGTKESRKKLARVTVALLVTGVVNAAAAALIDALRDDDDDEAYTEKFLQAFTGIEGDEENLGDYIGGILGGNVGDNLNPLGMVPYGKDLLSIWQGYDIDRMDMSAIKDLKDAADRFIKAVNGEGKQTVGYAIADLAGRAAKLLGLPFANVKRDLEGIVNGGFMGMEAAGMNVNNVRFAWAQLKTPINDKNKNTWIDMGYHFERNGDSETAGMIYDALTGAGIPAEKIEERKRYVLKKSEGFERRKGGVQSEVITDLEDSRGYRQLTGEQQEKAMDAAGTYAYVTTMLEQNPDYTLPDTYNWVLKAKGGASVGIEPWEYILFDLAYSTVEGDKDADGKTVAGSKQEKVIDALDDMTWLSDRERDYLYGTRYTSDKNNPFK